MGQNHNIDQLTFRMIGHASVLASYQGASILFDPWFGRPVNQDTFSGYPKFVPPTAEEIKTLLAVHISHIHYDHFCPADLEFLPRDFPILIGKYRNLNCDFVSSLKRAGFTNIIFVGPEPKSFEIGPFALSCFTKSPEDQNHDSSCVLSVAGQNFYLSNDCLHPNFLYEFIRHLFGDFQGAFLGYAWANPFIMGSDFSQCRDLKIPLSIASLSKSRQRTSWDHVEKVAEILSPKWVVPYASSYRFKSRDLAHLNCYFGVDEEIYGCDLSGADPIVLKHGDSLVASSGKHFKQDGTPIIARSVSVGPEVPEAELGPNLFIKQLSTQDMDLLELKGREFFLKLFERQKTKWRLPMTIEVLLKSESNESSLFYQFDGSIVQNTEPTTSETCDVEMEIPAALALQAIEGRITMAEIYILFCVKLNWRRMKYGQVDFRTWV